MTTPVYNFKNKSPLECKLVQPLWTTLSRFLRNLKVEFPYDPAISFLGLYLEKAGL